MYVLPEHTPLMADLSVAMQFKAQGTSSSLVSYVEGPKGHAQ